jgi:TfoX/Sxy family transcriptional regulator of competence genes
MAYDEGLADRISVIMRDRTDVVEKKMFGGLCFMVSGNMCCGIVKDTLMARVGPDHYDEYLAESNAREMDFTGRSMKGMIYVSPEGVDADEDLEKWVSRCIAFVETLPAK